MNAINLPTISNFHYQKAFPLTTTSPVYHLDGSQETFELVNIKSDNHDSHLPSARTFTD